MAYKGVFCEFDWGPGPGDKSNTDETSQWRSVTLFESLMVDFLIKKINFILHNVHKYSLSRSFK